MRGEKGYGDENVSGHNNTLPSGKLGIPVLLVSWNHVTNGVVVLIHQSKSDEKS